MFGGYKNNFLSQIEQIICLVTVKNKSDSDMWLTLRQIIMIVVLFNVSRANWWYVYFK